MVNIQQNFQNKRVTVMGLGLYAQGTGIEAVKFFLRHGARVVVTDLRTRKELKSAVEKIKSKKVVFVLGRHREEDFKNADLVFQNPSVPADSPYLKIARKHKIPIVNDWSLFLSRHTPKLFVGVTGTRGKSTTTALIYEMMKKHYLCNSLSRTTKRVDTTKRIDGCGERGNGVQNNKVWLAGNLGVSPLSFIDKYKGEPIVAELSSWLLHHFADVKKSPNIAVVTNIMNDHMNKYRNIQEYIKDKENIFKFQNQNGVLILHESLRFMGKKANGKVVWFDNRKVWNSNLIGEHNVGNVNAAVAVAKRLKIPNAKIKSVLKSFKGLKNRLELVEIVRGVSYYNDTTATTPEATIAALKVLGHKKNIVLICGGADKKLEYKELAREIKKYCQAVILLPGSATIKLKKGLIVNSQSLIVNRAEDMRQAVKKAFNVASEGDIVLLSPAAASFGLFKNEFDRGEQFVDAVGRL